MTPWQHRRVEIVLPTETLERIDVVPFAIVYAKIVEEHTLRRCRSANLGDHGRHLVG